MVCRTRASAAWSRRRARPATPRIWDGSATSGAAPLTGTADRGSEPHARHAPRHNRAPRGPFPPAPWRAPPGRGTERRTMTTAHRIDVGDGIDAALPLIRQHVDDIRDRRRLPDDVVDALRDTGLNRMMLPRSLGGLETPTADAIAAFENIAAADGSTGWCAVIGAGSNIFAGYLQRVRRPGGVRRPRPGQRHHVRAARHPHELRRTVAAERSVAVRQQLPPRRMDRTRRPVPLRERERSDALPGFRARRRPQRSKTPGTSWACAGPAAITSRPTM